VNRPDWPEDDPVSGEVEGELFARVDHLPAAEVDVYGGRAVRDERVPGAEDGVRERAVDALPDRVPLLS
jgi:hypothetical protein